MRDEEEYLISYANIKSGLFGKENNFTNPKKLKVFYEKEYLGFPICLPKNIRYFDYRKAKYFKIEKKIFAKKIFNTENLDYIGVKKFFRYGDIFAYNVDLKKKFKIEIKKYTKNIEYLKNTIRSLKLRKKKICAMQIRNVPHFGHEAVFKHILTNFDYLYLNPIFGIKKKNDFSNLFISKALKYIKKKYNNVEFEPLWTNFHYAGPREAFHHMLMRQSLGFDFFYVGRDHAGAENLYEHNSAIKKVNKFKDKFKIKTFVSQGGFYCKNCDKYVIKGICIHKNLKNISGTSFREYINKKKLYKHADETIQKILFKNNKK